MRLYEDDILEINIKEDILWVSWAERKNIEEFRPVADTILAFCHNLKVESLLVDGRKTQYNKEKPDSSIIQYLVTGLAKTNIKKLARILSENLEFESLVNMQNLSLEAEKVLPFRFRYFSDEERAIFWLKKEE